MEVHNDKTPYDIIGGTGFRAKLVCEKVLYKDVASGKKVYQDCISLSVPSSEREETEELLKLIERTLPSLVLFNASRFELAQKLLYTPEQELKLDEETEEN